MYFDLFKLHDIEKDQNARRCLRAYSVVPKYANKNGKPEQQAKVIVKYLRKLNEKLKKKDKFWQVKWRNSLPFSISQSSMKDWFIGRASIPLAALEMLKEFESKEELKEIGDNIEYISSTTRQAIKIPKTINKDIIYLTGLILGDGSIPDLNRKKDNNKKYRVIIISGDQNFLKNKICPLFKEFFLHKFPMEEKKTEHTI